MVSLNDAIISKYGLDEDHEELHGGLVGQGVVIHVPRTSQRKRLPSILCLDNCGISAAGKDTDIITNCQGVRELDLSHNCLTEWDEVRKFL